MGCAEGALIPSDGFNQFKTTVPPENDGDDAIKRWIGLTVVTETGETIDFHDVVLTEVDFGNEVELRVDVLGIPAKQYEALFPNHWQTYESRLN